MSDNMNVQSFPVLLNWILTEFEKNQSIFGIPRSLFYTPSADSAYSSTIFGQRLATPIGPAAGPHTQLTQNIIAAWLSGARFIELKTVQIMDELEIPRPCIDMEDEGYNVEWSQELKLAQSTDEYVKAWALIHILRRLLGFEESAPFGTVFNMSVGYDLAGVQSAPMTRFMDTLADASAEIAEIRATLQERFPQFADIEIPSQIADNVTLSTMHGCPPDEIERIALYLVEERGLHTFVKLNPTLLGQETVMHILHERLGFEEIHIPAQVFDHDLQYERAVKLIKTLQQSAAERGLTFGVKLSNTLAMANHKEALPGDEMYMSGRALYPITMNLFDKLAREFSDLNVSYAGGADALNAPTILSCGALPVTAASDLLKPGGYSRLLQYLENLEIAMRERGAAGLGDLARNKMTNLEQAAAAALQEPRYKKSYHPYGLPKVESGLELFDCITAPCVEQCPIHQDVPEYAWLISQGKYDQAMQVILDRNPLPGVTGYICTHVCQTRCTRNNYDEPVAIRALKRFASEHGRETRFFGKNPVSGARVAIIGSGPSGLAAAYYLALNGVETTIYEAKDRAGGMAAIAPAFRLPDEILQEDIARIEGLGVKIELDHPITAPPGKLLQDGYDAIYVATGAQQDARLGIAGEDGAGVYHVLDFLERVRRGEKIELGGRVLVIGGGNSAMDAARTARRLGGEVTIVYRRTRAEMPADPEEIEDALAEGVTVEELVSPTRVILKAGHVAALESARNELGEPGPDGRRRPVRVEDSEFQIEADSIIVAIGQRPDVSFLDGSSVSLRHNGTIAADPETGLAGGELVYAGGDAVRGPATIVEACADGRSAAEAICRKLGLPFTRPSVQPPTLSGEEITQVKLARAQKSPQHRAATLPVEHRLSFDLVEATLTEQAAQAEAARCMQCSTVCDKCVEVCPNRANYTVIVSPVNLALPVLSCRKGRLKVTGTEMFRVEQTRQIIHVDDLCNQCGNCATFCVHQGQPYLDKPRLFLQESDFEQEADNAFYVAGDAIRRREGGKESRLFVDNETGEMSFENEAVKVSLSPDFQVGDTELKEEFQGTLSLVSAAEMAVIFEGISTSLAFLTLEQS